MRHHALQTGRVYSRQHPGDGRLSLDELQDRVGRQGLAFSSRVLHYASSLCGTKQYWQRQRSRLLSVVDTLGLPTILFTHSAANLQWPELAQLICPDNPDSRTARAKAVIENPALADWFFYHRVTEFLKAFYIGVLGATDYWLRFEWQHRGSPLVHGLAWLPDPPDVEQLHDSANEEYIMIILSLPSTLLSYQMAVTLPMHQLQTFIPTSATSHIWTSRILIRTLQIWWPPARDTLAAQLPTASALSMASRSVALVTPNLCSHRQLLSERMSQLSSQLGMTG